MLNMTLGSKSKTTNFNTLSVKGKEISDPKEIANALNSHFCTTAKRVWKQSTQSQIKNATDVATFESFISKMPKTTKIFKFRKVTPSSIVYESIDTYFPYHGASILKTICWEPF